MGVIPLVVSSAFGLCIAPDTICTVWQRGAIEDSNAFILDRSWCNFARQECYPENGFGCTTEECLSVWTVYTPTVEYPQWIRPQAGIQAEFWAVQPDGTNQGGIWAGPADWNIDGIVNSTDFFQFLDGFFAGTTDYDLDGLVTSQDYFRFLEDFFE